MERPLQLSGELGGDYLVLDETTDCAEANKSASEQHRGRATIGNIALRPFASETGSERACCRVGRGCSNKDVSGRIKALTVVDEDVIGSCTSAARVSHGE